MYVAVRAISPGNTNLFTIVHLHKKSVHMTELAYLVQVDNIRVMAPVKEVSIQSVGIILKVL